VGIGGSFEANKASLLNSLFNFTGKRMINTLINLVATSIIKKIKWL
jgi:hypothetical protein